MNQTITMRSIFQNRISKREVMLLVLLTALFTWHAISWSEAKGKLSVPPDYDDSHSLVEGALRLHTFQESGVSGLAHEYVALVPHSFLHYYYTSIVFAIFGVHQSAVYWCNSLLLFAVLLVFYSILPPMPIIQKLCFVCAFLGIPVCFHLIHDFRSEVTLAGLLFIGSSLLVRTSWLKDGRSWEFPVAILVFLIAFGIKPAMFPYTAGILGLCSMIHLYAGFRMRKPWHTTVGDLCLIWTLSPLLLAIHLYYHQGEVLGYISHVAFKSDFYKLHDTIAWSFHWLGASGVWHLSALKTIMMLIVIGVLTLSIMRRLDPQPLDPIWHSFAFLMISSFAGIAINHVNNFFFGMTFQLFLTATSLAGLSYIYINKRLYILPVIGTIMLVIYWFPSVSNRDFLIPGSVIIVTLASFCFFQSVPRTCIPGILSSGLFALLCWRVTQIAPFNNYQQTTISSAGEVGLQWRIHGPNIVFEKIRSFWNKEHPPIVWFSEYGWVDGRTLSWEAVIKGIPWRMYNYDELASTTNSPVPETADIVIVPENGLLGTFSTETTSADKDKTILDFLNSRHYTLLDSVQGPADKHLFIYLRPKS